MKKLLVCTDGSPYASVCCAYGAWLANQAGASLDLLYVSDLRRFEVPVVADLSGSLGIQPYESMVGHLQELEKQKAAFIEETTSKIFSGAGLSDRCVFHHETGLLVDVIGTYETGADLVLLGKRGENADSAKGHLGSVLERVVRATDRPCLVTSRQFRAPEKVAIAYDGGESCQKAIAFMRDEAVFHGLEVHVVSVAENRQEGTASARLAEAEKELRSAGIKPVCQVLQGEVEDAIAGYLERADIGLLVAGAYGHSRIRELLIGSTTTQLLRRCRVPVLCFR